MRIEAVSLVNVKTNNIIKNSHIKRDNQAFMSACRDNESLKEQISDLRVFNHHIYEYEKGLRNLILTTEKGKYRDYIENKLQNRNIDYAINEVGNGKINVFFGEKSCVDVVKTFSPRLNELSAEQDFMLGIMLGYDRVKQCERYLKIKNKIILLRK